MVDHVVLNKCTHESWGIWVQRKGWVARILKQQMQINNSNLRTCVYVYASRLVFLGKKSQKHPCLSLTCTHKIQRQGGWNIAFVRSCKNNSNIGNFLLRFRLVVNYSGFFSLPCFLFTIYTYFRTEKTRARKPWNSGISTDASRILGERKERKQIPIGFPVPELSNFRD